MLETRFSDSDYRASFHAALTALLRADNRVEAGGWGIWKIGRAGRKNSIRRPDREEQHLKLPVFTALILRLPEQRASACP